MALTANRSASFPASLVLENQPSPKQCRRLEVAASDKVLGATFFFSADQGKRDGYFRLVPLQGRDTGRSGIATEWNKSNPRP